MDDDIEEEKRQEHNTYRNGRVHVLREQCSTCLFSEARPVSGDRMRDMVQLTSTENSSVVCHHTLDHFGEAKANAICRGWFELFAHKHWLLRLAMAENMIEEVEDPGVGAWRPMNSAG